MTRSYLLTTFNNNVGIKTEATNNFALNVNGVFQASSAIINGNITATTLSIGSITASANINVTNNITCGNANINGNITSQSANVNGNITTVSANINGYINGNSLSISGNITTNTASIAGKFFNNKQLANYIAIDVNANSSSLANYSLIYPLDVIGSTRNSTGQWLSGSDNRVMIILLMLI
jgi:cytoskeletal protein CcmA (bactofilin family)